MDRNQRKNTLKHVSISMDYVTYPTDKSFFGCFNELQHSRDPINLDQNDTGHLSAQWSQ